MVADPAGRSRDVVAGARHQRIRLRQGRKRRDQGWHGAEQPPFTGVARRWRSAWRREVRHLPDGGAGASQNRASPDNLPRSLGRYGKRTDEKDGERVLIKFSAQATCE